MECDHESYEHLQYGFKMKLGNGDSDFWYDSWFTKKPLVMHVPWIDIPIVGVRVRDLWRNGSCTTRKKAFYDTSFTTVIQRPM